MITRENYEEYFLLYVDNELSAAARSTVEQFAAANADLREELDSLLQCRVDPNQHEVFHDKEVLLQQDLLSYIDGELDDQGRRAVEEFVAIYPSKAVELQQLSMTVSEPDLSIVHPDKESLYRHERRKVVLLPWMQAGIAAAVLGLVALLLFVGRHRDIKPNLASTGGPANSAPPVKNIPPAVTPAKPAPLYSTGNDDQGRETVVVKNDQPKPKEQHATITPARVEQEAVAQIRQPDIDRTSASTSTTATSATTAKASTIVTPPVTSVTRPSEPVVVAAVHPDAAENPLIKPSTTVAVVNIPKEQSSFATQALLAEAQGDETKEDVAAAPAGKSKLRGLFRRVSRTFGKTAERDDDGQKEVLISAFQVGLK